MAEDGSGSDDDFGATLFVEVGARSRRVYLPGDSSTQWQDLRDGKIYEGGQVVSAQAALDTLPVFARNGKTHDLLGKI